MQWEHKNAERVELHVPDSQQYLVLYHEYQLETNDHTQRCRVTNEHNFYF